MTPTPRIGRKQLRVTPFARLVFDRHGFMLNTYAKLIGCNLARTRALIRGEKPTDDELNAIGALQIFCMLSDFAFSTEPIRLGFKPADHFECRLVPGCPITLADVWASGCRELCALPTRTTQECNDLLDQFDPEWRQVSVMDDEQWLAVQAIDLNNHRRSALTA